MKPRNKREREVVDLSSGLSPIENAKEWAIRNVFVHEAYKCKGELWCSDCAHTWFETDENLVCNNGCIRCPYCNSELTVKVNRRKKNSERTFMTIAQICGKYQVLRHIECCRYADKSGYLNYFFDEVVQEWITEDGKRTIMAKSLNTNRTGFSSASDLSIKNEYQYSCGYKDDCYALYGYLFPEVSLLPILHKRGLDNHFFDISPSVLIKPLLQGSNDYEYLIKTGQIDILMHIIRKGNYQIPYKHVINICNRNKYIVKDASMYFDYIDLLNYFRLDTHNAKYVCPKDLKQEHDKLMKRKRKIEADLKAKSDAEKKIQEMIKRRDQIKSFYDTKLKYLDLMISDGTIVIRPLQSVSEFYKEGKQMHHCVFSNSYFSKNDSLILCAHTEGKQVETIEININTFKIIQSRGKYNQATPYHDRIVKLVNRNINLIKQIA